MTATMASRGTQARQGGGRTPVASGPRRVPEPATTTVVPFVDPALLAAAPMTSTQVATIQRMAGNRAVAALMAQRAVQRKADACCTSCGSGGTCESEEEEARQDEGAAPEAGVPAAVQRFGWDDIKGAASSVGNAVKSGASAVGNAVKSGASAVGNAVKSGASAVGKAAGSLIPDWIKQLFTSAPREAERQQSKATQDATHAAGAADQQAQQTKARAQGDADRTTAKASTEIEQQHTQAQKGSTTAQSVAATTKAAAVGGLTTLATVAAPAMAPLVNPAIAIARPAVLDAAADRVGNAGAQVAGAVGKAVAPGLKEAGSAFDGYEWNCDMSEVASRAGKVGRGVFNSAVSLADLATGGRGTKVLNFASNLANRVRGVGQMIGGKVRGYAGRLKGFLSEKMAPIMKKVTELGTAVRARVDKVIGGVKAFAGKAKDFAVTTFNNVKARVTAGLSAIGNGLKQRGAALVGKIQKALSIVGSLISMIPGASGLIEKVKAGAEAVWNRAKQLAETAKNKLIAAKDAVIAHVKAKADQALQNAIRIGKAVGEKVAAAKKWIVDHKTQIILAIPGGPLIAAAAMGAAAIGSKIKSVATDVAKKASGAACTVVGDVGGPCVNQYLPNPGGGQTASITMTSTADVTLPLHEVGVPASVKLARGSTVTIKRDGDIFTLTIKGEGSATAVENLEASASGTASLNLPGGGGPGESWKRLGGNAPPAPAPALGVSVPVGPAAAAPAAAAPTASNLGQASAGGTSAGGAATAESPGASFEAGVKGTVEQEYQFDAKKGACAGLGGMLTLNAALGTAGSLPEPLCALARSGIEGAFLDQLQKASFTATAEGSAEIKLFEGGGASAAAKVSAELSAAASKRRATKDDARHAKEGEFIEELTLGGKLSGDVSFSIPAGPVSGLGGSVKPELSVALTLIYAKDKGRIEPSKAEGKLGLTVEVQGLDLGALGRMLPGPGGATAVDKLRKVALSPGNDKRTVAIETTITVKDLDLLYRELETYFAKPEQVTVKETIEKVKNHLASGTSRETKVTLTRSETMGAALGGQGTFEGATIGGNVGVSVEQAVETQIYPAA